MEHLVRNSAPPRNHCTGDYHRCAKVGVRFLVRKNTYDGYCFFAGGLAAVMYTDTLQCFVMILGAIILTIISKFLGLSCFKFKKIDKSAVCDKKFAEHKFTAGL